MVVVNPRRAWHAQRGLQYLVCVCVCVSVTTFSSTTRNRTSNKRYQQFQCDTGKVGVFSFIPKLWRYLPTAAESTALTSFSNDRGF